VPRLPGPQARLFLAAAAIGAWLTLLFLGRTAGGAVHLLALAGAFIAFWRTRAPAPTPEEP